MVYIRLQRGTKEEGPVYTPQWLGDDQVPSTNGALLIEFLLVECSRIDRGQSLMALELITGEGKKKKKKLLTSSLKKKKKKSFFKSSLLCDGKGRTQLDYSCKLQKTPKNILVFSYILVCIHVRTRCMEKALTFDYIL